MLAYKLTSGINAKDRHHPKAAIRVAVELEALKPPSERGVQRLPLASDLLAGL
jgi:hypothetical protein